MAPPTWEPTPRISASLEHRPLPDCEHDQDDDSRVFHGFIPYVTDYQETIHLERILQVPPSSLDVNPPALGRPTTKKRFSLQDLCAIIISTVCLLLAISTVQVESLSWRLGVGNNQLVVVGFLLSIMNLCLSSVTTTVFLLLEAKFGPSTLQNYEGILRNKIWSSELSTVWRLVFGIMLAIPIALSVAYKGFIGGESVLEIGNATDWVSTPPYYGLFAPPGVQSAGSSIGMSLFFNATMPFLTASAVTSNNSEPLPPRHGRAYGFNLLSLNNDSTAALDIPSPERIRSIQQLLSLRFL